jgi:pyridoxal phosphate enzyme (YggS family)
MEPFPCKMAHLETAPGHLENSPGLLEKAPAWLEKAPARLEKAPAWLEKAPEQETHTVLRWDFSMAQDGMSRREQDLADLAAKWKPMLGNADARPCERDVGGARSKALAIHFTFSILEGGEKMSIYDAIRRIENEVNEACVRAGRGTDEVRLMAVSKFHPRAAVDEALSAGVRLFGESRVKEALEKFDGRAAADGAELHLIGTLQRNKAKVAARLFDCIESLDRDELIDELGGLCAERTRPLPVLLELNSGEDAKSGYRGLDSLLRAAERVLTHKGLELSGLMTLAPFSDDAGLVRPAFRNVANAKKAIEERFGECRLSMLSMGMTNDFKIAIEEGSTLVRIGTAIFGERK